MSIVGLKSALDAFSIGLPGRAAFDQMRRRRRRRRRPGDRASRAVSSGGVSRRAGQAVGGGTDLLGVVLTNWATGVLLHSLAILALFNS